LRDKKIDDFIKTYVKSLKDNNAAIFAGAGLSKAAGFVDWKGLLKSIADDLNLDIKKEDDLISLVQYHINEKGGNRGNINQLLLDEFSNRVDLTENHKILARLPIQTYWTTNYDKLIEKALDGAYKTIDEKITEANLATNKPQRDAIVYKMHGDISQVENTVLSKDDYEIYNLNRQLFITALQGDLVSKTFLFLGFSFDDPNLKYILSRIRILLDKNKREHYCIFRRINRRDFSDADDFLYEKTKQELKIKDLNRYSITGLMVDEYSEITEILKKIKISYKKNFIFISGSAAKYGKWGKKKALDFIHRLSYKLVAEKFKIVSGFGLGVGSAVINGVMEYFYSSKYQHLDNYLLLRPFPQLKSGKLSIKYTKLDYRQEMISNAGIAIFLFGNKINKKGEIIKADGVVEEFKIAVQQGLKVLPVGATGYIAKDLWEQVRDNFNDYYNDSRLENLFLGLGDQNKSPEELIKLLIEIITIIE